MKNSHLIFASQFPNARPADLIFFANARKAKFYFVEFAGIQKMPMCLSAFFWHFSMLALTSSVICSFALMQKNQKIKAVMSSLKTDCTALKCKNSLRSNSLHFLTLATSVLFTGFYLSLLVFMNAVHLLTLIYQCQSVCFNHVSI